MPDHTSFLLFRRTNKSALTLLRLNYFLWTLTDMYHLCGLVLIVLGYRPRGPGPIPGASRFSEK
jgi:hypothetical protein